MAKNKTRITIADVAKQAQVSSMTVSRVINDKGDVSEATRQRVLDVMHKMEYRPNRVARSLASDRTLKIGVIVPDISSPFFSAILDSAEHVFWNNDYHMLLCNSGRNDRHEQDVLGLFEEDCVDGVLIFGSHLDSQQLSQLLHNQRAAVVFNCDVDTGVAGQIVADEAEAIAMAVAHLVERGRCRLGYIGVGERTFAMRTRISAFQHEMKRLGTYCDQSVMIANDGEIEDAVAQFLNSHPDTDGLLCFNDNVAVRAMRACEALDRRVPEDIAVIGYDDTEIASLVRPGLSTIRLALTKDALGALAARMLLERIDGQIDPEPYVLHPELVIRESAP